MAITINSRYALQRGPDSRIVLAQPIVASILQTLVRNVTWLWASLNRRVLFEWTDAAGLELTGSPVTVFRVPARISSGRENKTVNVYAEGTDVTVTVYLLDASGSTLEWSSLNISSGSGTTTIIGPADQDILVRVDISEYSTPGGSLTALRVMEDDLTSSSMLASPFKKIDDTAIAADEFLHAVLARRTVENLRSVAQYRTRSIACAWRLTDPPRFHGYARDGAGERMVIPFLWPSAQWASELTVRVRGTVVGEDITLGVAGGAPIATGGEVPPNLESNTLSAGAIDAAGSVTAQVDPRSWGNPALVFLTCSSDYDATGETLDNGGVTPDLSFTRWYCDAEANATWGGGPAFSNELLPAWVEWVYGTSSSTDRNLFDTPAPRFAFRYVEDRPGGAGNDALYFFPPIPKNDDTLALTETGKTTTGTWMRRHAMGYVELAAVEWSVTGVDYPDDWGTAYAPGATTSAQRARLLQTRSDQLFARTTRIHHMGPGARGGWEDPDTAFTGSIDKIASSIGYTATWLSIAECVVGDGDGFSYSGDNYTRVHYTVDALVAVVCQDPGATPNAGSVNFNEVEFQIDFRIQIAGTVTGDSDNGGAVEGVRFAPHVFAAYQPEADPVGYWLGFVPWEADDFDQAPGYYTPGAHIGRGAFPESLWPQVRFRHIRLVLKDTSSAANRILRLQAQFNASAGARPAEDLHPRLHLLTWTCYTTEGDDPAEVGLA